MCWGSEEVGGRGNDGGGPGVRLRMCLLALMILDGTCWGDRKEVVRDAWKTPVSCISMDPLAKLKKRLMQLPNKLIAWQR